MQILQVLSLCLLLGKVYILKLESNSFKKILFVMLFWVFL